MKFHLGRILILYLLMMISKNYYIKILTCYLVVNLLLLNNLHFVYVYVVVSCNSCEFVVVVAKI
jgi:hypothetical protein